MAHALRWGVLLLVCHPGWASAEAQPVPARPDPVVVMLSWDGLRHDYPDRTELPNLARIEREGVRAGRLTPVYPSNTFPGHVSLATGTYPDVHGIIDNEFYDADGDHYRYSSEADWLQAEPLWIAAERQGVPAATYFWVGSETDWRGQGTTYREAPFDGDRPEAAKVDRILEWLALPEAERPRLIMSYWGGTDHAGHDHGPASDEVTAALRAQDAQLGRLLAGMDELETWGYATLVLVSDHGMTDMIRFVNLRGALDDAGIAARVVGSAVAHVYLEDPAQADAALAAIADLEHAEGFRRRDVPAEWRLAHPTRGGDIVVVTEPPHTLSRPRGIAGYLGDLYLSLGGGNGGHGYRPDHPDMGGVFMAMGRGVPADLVLPVVHQVDVAPTVARLLGIEPPRQSEGRGVRGIGEHLIGDDPDDGRIDVRRADRR